MKLKDLDASLVPAAAERVAALADRFAVHADRVSVGVSELRGVTLSELDARFAAKGPLALLREVPQLGFVLIAAIFLGGAGTAVSREAARNRQAAQNLVAARPTAGPLDGLSSDTTLGPVVGDTTMRYFASSLKALQKLAVGSPDSSRLALVSFSDYRTPAQVQTMLAGYSLRRVYLRAKAAGPNAGQFPVDIKADLLPELQKAYAQTVRGRLGAQKDYLGYVNSLKATTPQEQEFKDQYAAFAKSSAIEAREYSRGCACVYAAVVEAKASQLLHLGFRPAVRGVQVAGKGLEFSQLQVLALLPEVVGAVPRRQAAVEGQP